MTYEQALQFWFGRINYEQRTLRPNDLKLDRMRDLLELLGNPHRQLPIVHIAGSKGKGSTAAMLATLFQKAGYTTGLFTSPHLTDFRERIQINGQWIDPEDVARLMEQVAQAVAVLDAQKEPEATGVTFFEIATALAFLHFLKKKVDVAVLEVGLGGRFDATNVCDPVLSIITSISFDHMQQLGNTLTEITTEKAGIIKPGRPVLSGAVVPEARAVIEAVCQERQAPLRQLGQDFHYTYEPGVITSEIERWPLVTVTTDRRRWPAIKLKLLGEHQAANAALVIAAVEELETQGFPCSDQAVAQGLAEVHWPARLEVVERQPLVILDCAHNLASAQVLLDALQKSFPLDRNNGSPCRRYLVFAGSFDKDLAGMLQVLAPYFDHIFLTRYQNNPRSVPPEQLGQMVQRTCSVPFTICPSPGDAWQQVKASATINDLICITGSVFLAGELSPLLGK